MAIVLLVASGSLAAQAQAPAASLMPPATLVGSVRDSAGHPLGNAEIWLRGSDLYTHTNDAGGFRLPAVPEGDFKVSVRRLGYAPALVDIKLRSGQIDSLVLELTPSAASLPGVLVTDEADSRNKRLLAGFWDRREKGFGHFFTREEIEKRDPHEFVDIVRTTPGLQIVTRGGRPAIRFRQTGNRDCAPQYWVDGVRVENASPDEFTPHDVEGIEVYNGAATTPSQFAPKPTTIACGTIVIWTRLPGT
jgi:hypothetical protein